MKVLLVSPAYYPNLIGGNERSVQMLAEGLASKGVDVNILSFDNKTKESTKEVINNVKIIRVKNSSISPQTLAFNFSLIKNRKIVDEINPDIIHIFNTYQIPVAYFLRNKHRKVIGTLNNYFTIIATSYTQDNIIEKKKVGIYDAFSSILKTKRDIGYVKRILISGFYSFYSEIVRFISKRIDGYVVYSKGIQDIFVKNGFSPNKFTVISSFHDVKLYGKKTKRQKNAVLYVGGIYEAKGFYELLEAARIVNDKNVKFYFVGVKDIPMKVKDFIAKNKINAELIGKLDHEDLAKYYRTSTVLVHPSQWPEPFARTWIEGLSYDIPIISSDNPVALSVLKDSAAFYRRGHPEELADKIKKVLNSDIKLNDKIALARIKKSKPVDEMISLYKRLKKDEK